MLNSRVSALPYICALPRS